MVTKKMPPRRQRILVFLQEFYSENGIPPTVRDIQKACEISSTSVVDYNLDKLSQAGYINRRRDVARGIEVLDEQGAIVEGSDFDAHTVTRGRSDVDEMSDDSLVLGVDVDDFS